MVTSPNWMAPFHIARATAGPRARLSSGPAHGWADRLRMISRPCKPTASRDQPEPSTQDDESVQVAPARPRHAELDPMGADGREGRDVDDRAAEAGRPTEADEPLVDPVHVDAG